jgi:hypothetical protein
MGDGSTSRHASGPGTLMPLPEQHKAGQASATRYGRLTFWERTAGRRSSPAGAACLR